MCIAPCRLPDGIEVACRNCWQCKRNKVNDFVGRCIAETKNAHATHIVTLTYGRDAEDNPNHERSNYLTYSDVQKWFKRLRVEGYPLRYLVAGEYGSGKGRAHWHVVLFWQKAVPPITLNKRLVQAWWDHGFSFWEKPDSFRAFKYVCKYVLKDTTSTQAQSHFMMSKAPPLGVHYFRQLAEDHVKQGLAPQDLFYRFREAGKSHQFKMKGRAAEMFLEHFVQTWKERRSGEIPNSELVEDYLDKLVTPDFELQRKHVADYVHRPKKQNLLSYMSMENVTLNEYVNAFQHIDPKTNYRLYWAKNPKGEYQWQGVIGRGGSRLPPTS